MEIRSVTEGELATVAAFVSSCQQDPATHVVYDSVPAEAVAQGLHDLDPDGLDGVLVAWDGDDVAGVLGVEHDTAPPRVWWHGPYVALDGDLDRVGRELLDAGRGLLPPQVTQEELAPDARNTRLAELAVALGFHEEEGSAVLSADLAAERTVAWPGPAVAIRELAPADAEVVSALHDEAFPGTHTPGTRVVQPREGEVVLVAVLGGRVAGYVKADLDDDGTGYLDFLAVADGARGRGCGRALVDAVCEVLRDRYDCPSAHLTVRLSSTVPRRLYASLGFVEERVIRPFRLGFSLDGQHG